MRTKKNKKVILYLIVILGLTIGFALLGTTLKINGTASIKPNDWNIFWDENSIVVNQDSVEATSPVEVTGAKDDTIEFTVDLELPGDFYEFTINAKNTGSVDGIITDIDTEIYEEDGETSATLPNYLKFSVKYSDNTTPTEGDIISKNNGTSTYKVRVEFDSNATTLPSTAEKYVIKYHVTYDQYREEETGPVTFNTTKTTVSKNEEVKIKLKVTAASWNLHLTGAVTTDEVGYNNDGNNETFTREYTVDTSTAGQKTINLTGDVTDEDDTNTEINKSITITVTE